MDRFLCFRRIVVERCHTFFYHELIALYHKDITSAIWSVTTLYANGLSWLLPPLFLFVAGARRYLRRLHDYRCRDEPGRRGLASGARAYAHESSVGVDKRTPCHDRGFCNVGIDDFRAEGGRSGYDARHYSLCNASYCLAGECYDRFSEHRTMRRDRDWGPGGRLPFNGRGCRRKIRDAVL